MKLSTINYQLLTRRGFTLIELLVVIIIIGILAAVVMLAINPAEMMKRGRDATRFEDLDTVRKAIGLVLAEGTVTLPPLGAGPYNSVTNRGPGTEGAVQMCNNTGWVALDICIYLATLPKDPTNSTTYQYQFRSDVYGNYEIRAQIEASTNYSKAQNDGGDDNTCPGNCWYEVGTDPALDLM